MPAHPAAPLAQAARHATCVTPGVQKRRFSDAQATLRAASANLSGVS
jgi:hypothetical protein